jgi:hypothetical protein
MIPLLGKGLEILAKVAIIPIRPNWDPSADGGIEFLGIFFPLLEGIVLEELLVEFPTDLGDDDLLGVGGTLNGNPLGCQPCLELLA